MRMQLDQVVLQFGTHAHEAVRAADFPWSPAHTLATPRTVVETRAEGARRPSCHSDLGEELLQKPPPRRWTGPLTGLTPCFAVALTHRAAAHWTVHSRVTGLTHAWGDAAGDASAAATASVATFSPCSRSRGRDHPGGSPRPAAAHSRSRPVRPWNCRLRTDFRQIEGSAPTPRLRLELVLTRRR